MKVVAGTFDDLNKMLEYIKPYLEQGYKIVNSNLAFKTVFGNLSPTSKEMYYILLQKE